MVEGLNKLRCGACGCDTVRVFANDGGRVFTECTQCKSLTEIAVTPPKIDFKFPLGVKSEGILAAF